LFIYLRTSFAVLFALTVVVVVAVAFRGTRRFNVVAVVVMLFVLLLLVAQFWCHSVGATVQGQS